MGARERWSKFSWTCRKINWITHAAPRFPSARALVAANGFGSFGGAVGPSVSGKGWAHRAQKDAVAESWTIRLRADLASGRKFIWLALLRASCSRCAGDGHRHHALVAAQARLPVGQVSASKGARSGL